MVILYKDPHGTKIFRNPHSEIIGESANGTRQKLSSKRNNSTSELMQIKKVSLATVLEKMLAS